jgi:hypothetical protein
MRRDSFCLGFHDEKLIDKARAAMAPAESSFVPSESAPLDGLWRVMADGLRFAVFSMPARVITHARQLFARVARVLSERCDLLPSRRRLRDAWHSLLLATRLNTSGLSPWPAPSG